MKPVLIISAVNIFEGGPLSVLKDCVRYLNQSNYARSYRIIVLVYSSSILQDIEAGNVEVLEFPSARKSYFHKLYIEYFYFRKFASNLEIDFWLSLNDVTPNVRVPAQAVYCHNPSPFYNFSLREFKDQPKLFLFSIFYKYLYRANIQRNKYVIVQQDWIKQEFAKRFGVPPAKIVVAQPADQETSTLIADPKNSGPSPEPLFVFPTFPRPFKNIEVIGNAIKLLEDSGVQNFKVIVTLDGTENKYARRMVTKYGHLSCLKFIGLINREAVFGYYRLAKCLIFPSKLETWGLPISEFKKLKKPMLVANLPYAKETVGQYDHVKFFDTNDHHALAKYMKMIIENEAIPFDQTSPVRYVSPYAGNWKELFSILLNGSRH